MKAPRCLAIAAVVVLAFLAGGCADAVSSAARSSLGSFLTSVFSAAVNSALNP